MGHPIGPLGLGVYEAENYPLHRAGGHLRGPSTAPITVMLWSASLRMTSFVMI
jgi:hypothetical protein